MKITPEHKAIIKDYIRAYVDKHNMTLGEIVDAYEMQGLSERRMCFDLIYAAGLTRWVCLSIYPYANDDHLYSTTRRAVRELVKEEEETVKNTGDRPPCHGERTIRPLDATPSAQPPTRP
jgi:hypothetical protein